MDRRLESVERVVIEGFNRVDARFDQMESRIDQRLNWLIGIVMTSWLTMTLTILFHR